MKGESMMLNPNCSEAVFRFYTLDPEKMRYILQAIADEISANSDDDFKGQKIPNFETAEEFQRMFHDPTENEIQEHIRIIEDIRFKFVNGEIDLEKHNKMMSEEWNRWNQLKYPQSSYLKSIAGLGDNEAVITVERDRGSFRLNIGNNLISDNTTGWVEKVLELGIRVEEAETSADLARYARDCTCGIIFFPNTKKTKIDIKKQMVE